MTITALRHYREYRAEDCPALAAYIAVTALMELFDEDEEDVTFAYIPFWAVY